MAEEPGRRTAGVLTVAGSGDERTELRLIGSFEDGPVMRRNVEYPLVHGVVKQRLVTLAHLQETNAQISIPAYSSQTLMPHTAFFGGHLHTPNPDVTGAWLRLSYLPEWVGAAGIAVHGDGRSASAAFTAPDDIACGLPWGALTIRTRAGTAQTRHRSATVETWCTVELRFTDPTQFTAVVEEYTAALQNLLTLAAGTANAVVWLEVEPAEGELVTSQPGGVLDVTYDPQFRLAEPPPRIHPQSFLFRASDVGDRMCEAFAAWFDITRELDAVLDLHFSTRYAERLFLETRFLNAAQAAEVYHRRRFVSEILPKVEHRARVKAVAEAAPKGLRKWAKEVLSYSNEKRFAERLHELIGREGGVMDPLVEDRDEFVRTVVRSGTTSPIGRRATTHHAPITNWFSEPPNAWMCFSSPLYSERWDSPSTSACSASPRIEPTCG